jgi:alkenylglycerophosphocholine hydrolase
MPSAWWAALGFAVLYLGTVALGRKGPLKVLPASLLAVAMWPVTPWVGAAMAACALGDAFLLNKDRYFLHGLAAFLVGHALLIPALLQAAARAPSLFVLAIVVAAFLGVLGFVLPRVSGAIRLAIPVYAAALGAMLVAAAAVSPLALAGAAIFAVSDSLLAVNRFVRPLPGAEIAVSLTYQAALLLLTAAILASPPSA